MLEDAFTVISEEIDKIEGYKKRTATNVEIVCPFHEDSKPSCSINMSHEAKVRIGTFSCWACDARGGWNKLAAKLNLRQIKDWQHFNGTTAGSYARVSKYRKDFENTNNYTLDRLFEEVGGAVLPWPKKKEWRGYKGKLISDVQGYMFNEDKRDELMLVLPIYINGRYKGGVKAFWEKPKDGPSYLNISGDWVMEYGLLGYDYVRSKDIWGCDSIVLVEGPRDWLRLAQNEIPCCAILGSKMFSETKLMLLISLGIRKVYSLADNDKAGRAMVKLIRETCEGHVEFEELELPRKKDEEGELIKLDPDSASQKIIDKVKTIVYEKIPEKKFVKKKKADAVMPPVEIKPKKKVKRKKAA